MDDAELLAFGETLRPRVVTAPVTTVASPDGNVSVDGTAPVGMQFVREDTVGASGQTPLESRYEGSLVKQVTMECVGIGCYEAYRADRIGYAHVAAATVHHQPAIAVSEDGRQWRVVFNEHGLWTYDVTVDARDADAAARLVDERVVDLTDDAWAALAARVTPASSPANVIAEVTAAGAATMAPPQGAATSSQP